MMAKNSEFEEEMRKSDTAAYRAGLADEPGTESTAAFMKRTGTKANRPKATVGGPRIVTKEELKKSGFTNLRDFLNDERKLKRRDGKPAERVEAKVEPAKPKAEPAKTKIEKPGFFRRTIAALGGVKLPQADYGTKSKEDDEKPVARSKPVSTAARIAAANQGYKKGGKVESKLMGKEGRGMAKATMQKVASKAVKAHEGRMHKAKSGSSVSKRADGAAIRGKTRGRMV
jgi:hypothetical protein